MVSQPYYNLTTMYNAVFELYLSVTASLSQLLPVTEQGTHTKLELHEAHVPRANIKMTY